MPGLRALWRDERAPEPVYSDRLELDLGEVEPSVAGPRRPQERAPLTQVAARFSELAGGRGAGPVAVAGADWTLDHGAVVIAAITSCTNTSNPAAMMAAGLVARKALERGLKVKPWVKTSIAPGSQVVSDYLARAGLQRALDAQGFNLVGYGCTTCIGNSGPLPEPVREAIEKGDLVVCSVLSGNRNFEGRVHALTRANYLASPPLVVAYALAGSVTVDLAREPLGRDGGRAPGLPRGAVAVPGRGRGDDTRRPGARDVRAALCRRLHGRRELAGHGGASGAPLSLGSRLDLYPAPAFFEGMAREPAPPGEARGARTLALLGDGITTDHISPAGAIAAAGPAGRHLREHGVAPADFNSYGSRRGNHRVMMRGTFANLRLRNEMMEGREGGFTRHQPSGETMTVFDAAMRYRAEGVPLVIVAGKEYGAGSSRDWAAKGTALLGVRAVLAESFERIHRSNLIGMGVLPLQFLDGGGRASLGLDGGETWDIAGSAAGLAPSMEVEAAFRRADGGRRELRLLCRIDTANEVECYRNGGILHHVLRQAARGVTTT